MKTIHDGTIALNTSNTYISCVACGQKVIVDSKHTCAKQFKTLTDEGIMLVIRQTSFVDGYLNDNLIRFARAILKEASEK